MSVQNVRPPQNSNLTIDLNGYDLEIYWNLFNSAGTSLRLMDSSPNQTGTMSTYVKTLFYIGADVHLTIDGGNYVCEEKSNANWMFSTNGTVSGSSININGGNFRMEAVGTDTAHAMFQNFVLSTAQTVINGGTFSAVDGTYVFRVRANQSIEEALQNVTINGGTFGDNTLGIGQTPEAYLTVSSVETLLSTEGTNIFKTCTFLRLTDDFLITSVKLNDNDLGQIGKEVTISPTSLNTGNGDDGKNTLVVADFEGNTVTYIFYIDNVAPAVTSASVSPENGQVYYGGKTFTFETSEPIRSPGEGWTDVSDNQDGTKWTKKFTTNQKFTLTLTDLAGNTVTTDRYEVKNIETETLTPQVTYSTTDPTREDVTVTIKTNVECQTPEGWTRAESNKKNLFQKIYSKNAEETVTFFSLGGQQVSVEIKISNIDKEAPQLVVDISFSPDNSKMSLEKVVTFEANETVISPGEGWTEVEGSNGVKWQKVYQKAMKDSITLTDLAGNTSDPINFEVKRIEDTKLAAEVIYSNEGLEYTNQDVTVTIKTNVECQTPEGWTRTGNKRNQFEKTFSADAEETVTLVSLAGQTISQQISVKGIDKVAPKAYINGTNPIEYDVVYNDSVSLEFSDNAALDRYELNGQKGPTDIRGSKWGDGNYQDIKSYLKTGNNDEVKNILEVWDKAGNSTEYVFYVDQTGPNITVNVEDPDVATPTKTVTLRSDEPFKLAEDDRDPLWFNPKNDDDNDGYATEWTASATKPLEETYTVEDLYGNQSTVAVTVTNVNSEKPTVTINHTLQSPALWDDTVQLIWNIELSDESVAKLEADGWKHPTPTTFVKTYKQNARVVYTGLTSYTGIPADSVVISVTNIQHEYGVKYHLSDTNEYIEGKVVALSDAEYIDLSTLTDIPEGYELVITDPVQISDGWIYVELQRIVTTKEVGVNYYIPAEDRYLKGKVVVDKDATIVDLTTLTDVPESYEVIEDESIPEITYGWIYVELQKIVTTKEVGIIYYIPEEGRYAMDGKVIVDKDATIVDLTTLTDIPEGYEVIEDESIPEITYGWIYVELQRIPF